MCRNRRIWLAVARQHEVRSAARWVFQALMWFSAWPRAELTQGSAGAAGGKVNGGAVDVLVNGAAAHTIETGDDEAGVDALRSGLDAGDDALDAVPACGASVEFLEPAQLLAVSLGSARDRAGLQRGDMLAQRGGRRDAEDVIEPLGATEAQHLRRACVDGPWSARSCCWI